MVLITYNTKEGKAMAKVNRNTGESFLGRFIPDASSDVGVRDGAQGDTQDKIAAARVAAEQERADRIARRAEKQGGGSGTQRFMAREVLDVVGVFDADPREDN